MIAQVGLEQESFKNLLERFKENQSLVDDTLARIRQKAWDYFLSLGLPSRRSEQYRYIKLRHLFSHSYELAFQNKIEFSQIKSWIYPESQKSVLVFVNGRYESALSSTENLSSKIVISSLKEAYHTYGALLNNTWNKSIKEEKDPFAVLNASLHPEGAFVYIPPKTVADAPIQILNIVDNSENLQIAMPRLQIFVGSGADVCFVSSQQHLNQSGYFVNGVTELVLEEAAQVKYLQMLTNECQQGWHFDAFRAILKRDSSLKTVCITKGSTTVRMDYKIQLAGENSEVFLNGVCMLADKREGHVHVVVDHQAPHCRSNQLFKTVLNDFSRSSFAGEILVEQAAQKTEAFQLNNNLILSDRAHADSKPNLEVFADDVKASHGATVGQLDPDQLFYMKTRGFSDEAAKNLLIYGFCEEIIEMLTLDSVREKTSNEVRQYLTKSHK